MQRSRLKNIINKSKDLSKSIGDSFEQFKKLLPIDVDDNYRLKAAWKAYGSPKNYQEALWQGLIQPIDENTVKLPSIGYNEETDEYEYLNKGRDNETVAKDIRVWDNDVIPLVKELKLGGYVRTFNEEKDCWIYTKNSQKEDTLDQNKVNVQKEQSDNIIEQFQEGGKTSNQRTLEELTQYAIYKNPRFIQRLFEDPKAVEFKDEKGEIRRGSHLLGYITADGAEVVFPNIQEDENGNLKYYDNWKEAFEQAKKNKDLLFLNPGEGDVFTSGYEKSVYFKPYMDKWNIQFSDYTVPVETQAFKQGGQMNVIPEGALHARKNNMELAKEGEVTHKGVPVVDNDGVQQAEVEKEEWTMTKELTDDVEVWYKKYYNEETAQKEKDELAIKCGKRIVKELLHNTDDRANLIAKMLEEEE